MFGSEPPSSARVARIAAEEMREGAEEAGSIVKAAVLGLMSADRRSGSSMGSVYVDVDFHGTEKVTLSVGATDEAVRYMDEGTGLYGPERQVIRPRKGRVLRFPNRGTGGFTLGDTVRAGRRGRAARYVHATFVRGVMPRHYFRRAEVMVEPLVNDVWKRVGRGIADRLVAG